jgi:hypothetical protein
MFSMNGNSPYVRSFDSKGGFLTESIMLYVPSNNLSRSVNALIESAFLVQTTAIANALISEKAGVSEFTVVCSPRLA